MPTPLGNRMVFPVWGNPFTSSRRANVITAETHIVEHLPWESGAFYGIRLAEIPERGTVSITDEALAAYSEVFIAPAAGEYRVDYEPDATNPDGKGTGYIELHVSEWNADPSLATRLICEYTGQGTLWGADIYNEAEFIQPLFPFFAGDASDGDKTTAGDETWNEISQFRDCTISAGDTVSPNVAVHRLLVGVTRRLTIIGAFDLDDAGMTDTDGGGAFGGGGAYGTTDVVGHGCGGGRAYHANMPLILRQTPAETLTGRGGWGGNNTNQAGEAGYNHMLLNFSAQAYRWPWVRTLIGQAGGRDIFGGNDGGNGGGSIVIECNELDFQGAGQISAEGHNGAGAKSGCGAGGTAFIFFRKLIANDGAISVAGGISAGGGNGSDGLSAIVNVRNRIAL